MSTTRIESYLARVDERLATLSPAAGREFLDDLSRQWERRYADFRARVHRGAPTPPGTTAFDYIETIAGLDQRFTKQEAA